MSQCVRISIVNSASLKPSPGEFHSHRLVHNAAGRLQFLNQTLQDKKEPKNGQKQISFPVVSRFPVGQQRCIASGWRLADSRSTRMSSADSEDAPSSPPLRFA